MRYLIDTQIAIWVKDKNNSDRLTRRGREIVENLDNSILISQFSLMELAIKLKIGKLPNFIISVEEFAESLVSSGFNMLPISSRHILAYQTVPFYEDHRDPFDRFIIAAAFADRLTLVSADDKFDRYDSFIDLVKI